MPASSSKFVKCLGIYFGDVDDGVFVKDCFKKLLDNINLWYKVILGFNNRVLVCNVFLIPIVMYIGSFVYFVDKFVNRVQCLLGMFVMRFPYMKAFMVPNVDNYFGIKAMRGIRKVNVASLLRVGLECEYDDIDSYAISSQIGKAVEFFNKFHVYEHFLEGISDQIEDPKFRFQSHIYSFLHKQNNGFLFDDWFSDRFYNRFGINVDGSHYERVDRLKNINDERCKITFLNFFLNAVCTKKRSRFWVQYGDMFFFL